MKRRGKKNGAPPNATAVCLFHERLMNDKYIRQRGCLMRRKPCKHLRWLAGAGCEGGGCENRTGDFR